MTMRVNYQVKVAIGGYVSSDWNKSMLEISFIIHLLEFIKGGEYSTKKY